MPVKLTKKDDRVVFLGKTAEEVPWGFVQFPRFLETPEGDIGLYVHNEDDNPHFLGCGSYFISKDGGETFSVADERQKMRMGKLLPNGDILNIKLYGTKKLEGVREHSWYFGNYRIPSDDLRIEKSTDPKVLPKPITVVNDIFECQNKVYYLDTLPDGMCDNRFKFSRLRRGENESETEYAPVEWKYRTIITHDDKSAYSFHDGSLYLDEPGLFECRQIKVAPDNSLYIAHYRAHSANPYTGQYLDSTSSFILRSVDNGHSWKLQGFIPYVPDDEHNPFAHLVLGFDEPSIEFCDDGSMICLMRTCDVFRGAPEWGPSYLARSFDMGKTWTKPEFFADRGALPHLLKLKNGVILAVITRPGIYVYASDDNGKTWDSVIEIMTDEDRSKLANVVPERPNFHQWAGSCCNTSIIALDENTALLAYSDFYIPDENGVKRKGIKTVKIKVEK